MANYTVFKDGDAEPEIDTPNVSVHPSHHDGVFRVEVRPDGDTIVIVRKGEAQIATPQGSTEVRSGEMATIRGTSTDAQYKISDAPGRDDWDRWNSDRDRIITNAQAWHHTNRYYVGSEDLDAYGRWKHVPDYGDVWVPDQSDDWAPYRDGHWVYEPYYGWTWVGYEPWGWAPYHYGRWFYYDTGWAWWPGPVYGWYRPFWAPAYVSFFGWGGGWGFGAGFGGWGGFGWFPVGPCDGFFPWWGGWRNRFNVVNVTNINIVNINRNRFGGFPPLHSGNRFSNLARIHDNHVGRALSTVNAGRFGAGRVQAVAVSRAQLSGARLMTGNLPVVPSRASLSASGRAAAPSTVHTNTAQRFFGNNRSVARPESFQQHTAQLQQSMQRSRVAPIVAGGRVAGNTPGARGTTAFGTGQKPGASMPAREMNPGARNTGGQTVTPQNGNRGGFRPFTPPSNNTRTLGPGNTPAQRSVGPTAPAENGNRGGFRPFTPSSNNPRTSEPNNIPSQRTMSPSAPAQNGSRGGFRPFTPPSRSESMPSSRSSSGGYWNRTAPSSQAQRSYGSSSSDYGRGSSRPQLDMRQPVVQPRSSGSYGGYRGSPSYSAPRSSPSYGGHSAPSSGGGSRGGGYSGGGGGHSSGAHSSGGGGGSHSSGGGHSSSGHR